MLSLNKRLIQTLTSDFQHKRRVHFDREAWAYLLQFFRPKLFRMIPNLLGHILLSQSYLLNLWAISYGVGTVIPSGNFREMLWLGLFYLAARLLLSVLDMRVRHSIVTQVGLLVRDMRKNQMDAILRGFSLSRPSRDTRMAQSQLYNETRNLQEALLYTLEHTLPALAITSAILVVVAVKDFDLMLLLFFLLPVFAVLLRTGGYYLYKRGLVRNRAENAYHTHLSLVFHFLDHIRVRNTEELEGRYHAGKVDELFVAQRSVSTAQQVNQFVNTALNTLLFLAVLVLGSREVMAGRVGIEGLLVLFLALNILYIQFNILLHGYSRLLTAGETLHVLKDQVQAMDDIVQWTGQTPVPTAGSLSLQGVCFRYPGREVLKGVDLTLASGNTVAIIGENGAGKTTLLQILLGLRLPDAGSLRYGGVGYPEIDMAAFRRLVGYVPQRPRLLPGTVRSNLCYGLPDKVADAQLYEALRLAMAAELIEALGQGLDSPIGDDGARLSGGERQRLAIASALVGKPRILVMDEPTNHLDRASIGRLMLHLKNLPDPPSILLITHHTDMLSLADRIFRLEDGRLTEVLAGEDRSRLQGHEKTAAGPLLSMGK